jgi:hypothetical protein
MIEATSAISLSDAASSRAAAPGRKAIRAGRLEFDDLSIFIAADPWRVEIQAKDVL